VIEQREFAALLETVAATVAETEPGAGALFSFWALGVRSIRRHCASSGI
jgi:hypothetical protein